MDNTIFTESEKEKVKTIVSNIIDYHIKTTSDRTVRNVLSQIKNDADLFNLLIESILRFLTPEKLLIENIITETTTSLDTEYEKYLKKWFYENIYINPRIIRLTHQILFNQEVSEKMLDKFYNHLYSILDESFNNINLNHDNNNNETIITEEFFLTTTISFLIHTKLGLTLLSVIGFTLFNILALEYRWYNRLWLKFTGYIKSLGELLKDVQKENITIEKFFDNIPPECFKKFKDIEKILQKDIGILGVGIKDPKELEHYSPEVLDKIKKKLLSMDFTKWGVWNKNIIKQTKATDCTIRYMISNLGIALTLFYKCLYKNHQLKILNDILNIKSHDLLMSKGDILDVFAQTIDTVCLSKYKEFKKQFKFILDVIDAIYKDDYQAKSTYIQLIIDTINKAQKEGEQLLKKIDKNRNSRRNDNKFNNPKK